MPVSTVSSVAVLTNQQERDQINSADASLTPAVVATDRNDQRVAPVAQSPVPLASPPASLTAGADTALTFTTQSGEAYSVRRIIVQNKSAVNVYLELEATASAGSLVVYPQTALALDLPCNVLHVYCSAALAVNGTADGNLVLKGWL